MVKYVLCFSLSFINKKIYILIKAELPLDSKFLELLRIQICCKNGTGMTQKLSLSEK